MTAPSPTDPNAEENMGRVPVCLDPSDVRWPVQISDFGRAAQ